MPAAARLDRGARPCSPAEPMTKRRYVDVDENGLYWHFVVAWWIPTYLTIYFAPRWL